MRFFAGIDGGQTATSAVLADETGRVLSSGSAGPADEVHQSPESTRLRDALCGALRDALANCGLDPQTLFTAVVAGVSGYEGRVYGAPPDLPANSTLLVHDAVAAHAGAFTGEPGVIVIAGTGSVSYGRNARGAEITAGGWGYLFGDEGSGFWLARMMVKRAMYAEDAGEDDPLRGPMLQHFEQPSLRALARAFYAGEIDRANLAGFAVRVLADPEAGEIVPQVLASLAATVARRLDLPEGPVALTGGLAADAALRERFAVRLAELLPGAHVQSPRLDPARGALLLALRSAGIDAVPR